MELDFVMVIWQPKRWKIRKLNGSRGRDYFQLIDNRRPKFDSSTLSWQEEITMLYCSKINFKAKGMLDVDAASAGDSLSSDISIVHNFCE